MALSNLPLVGSLFPAAATVNIEHTALIRAMESPAQARFRQELAWHYYKGDMYRWLKDQQSTEASKEKAGHYQDIAPYFNPVKEIVDVDAAKVFAPPISGETQDAALDARLNALWTRSGFETLVRNYVQAGAAQGTVYLHVLDGPMSRIAVKRPDEIDVLKHPQTGAIIAAKVSRIVSDPLGIESDPNAPGIATGHGQPYNYDFVMTPTEYATLKNGVLWPFSDNPTDANGRQLARWPNRLGFVPVVEVIHSDDGDGNGVSAWEAVKPTIDAANEIASFMAETVKMHIDPLIVVYGVDKGDVEKKILRGRTNVFYLKLPELAMGTPPRLELMEWRGNVADVTGFITWVKDRLADVVPELHMSRIQDQASPAGYSVALQSMPLSDHIGSLRSVYFEKLVEADRIALWAEDVHTGIIDPLVGIAALLDETNYAHSINVGPIFPKDAAGEVSTASTMLRDGVIPKEEYLIRAGYALDDARRLVRAANQEAEDNAARAMGVMETAAEAKALRDGNAADGNAADGNAADGEQP